MELVRLRFSASAGLQHYTAKAVQSWTVQSTVGSRIRIKAVTTCRSNATADEGLKFSSSQRQPALDSKGARVNVKSSNVVSSASSPSSSASSQEEEVTADEQQKEQGLAEEGEIKEKPTKGYKSSWTAKDAEGKDYLYRLGSEADNMNITVGARAGMIDSLFTGDFLGLEADIVFKYRQKVTRSFNHIQGDYYIAPLFLDKVGEWRDYGTVSYAYWAARILHLSSAYIGTRMVQLKLDLSSLTYDPDSVTHVAKNYLAPHLETRVPLILGVWGGKGQGKSFQIELICKALDLEPVIMSAGEMESEWAGQPGRLIRERYRTASQVIKNQGKMSALIINDLDAGIGRFENTQCTVNNQMVVGTLMNLCDNPTRVSIGQEWREADIVNRVPIIVTGNDFSTLWAPLIRDGRMDKFYWQPTREDIINTVFRMYIKDGITQEEIASIVDRFPNQALDFYGALRSRTYDVEVLKWATQIGTENLAKTLVNKKRDTPLPVFIAPEQTVEKLIEAGNSLVEEQNRVMEMRLSDEYMRKQTGPSIGLLA